MTAAERDAYATGEEMSEARILPGPRLPMAVARRLIEERYRAGDCLVLRHWRGGWWWWCGSHWRELEERAVRRDAYLFTENALYLDGKGALEPWAPTRNKISNLLEAAAAVTHLEGAIDQPSWIGDEEGPEVVATANGLLELRRRLLLPHTPRYFNQTAVPFRYDPTAPIPSRWLGFLYQLWRDDPEAIAALAEFFGYVVSGRLDLHKILLIVGPTRAGKGTIARILGKLVGPHNVAGPTLSSLSFDFGLAPLIGKPLAVISDARLDVGRDASIVVERLLAISGEDTITVNRKYREQWSGRLPTRFVVISNELPRLGDASGTIANRFVVLQLSQSWLGREDLTLEAALTTELPGILNWSLQGLDRLTAQGRFTRPASTDEAIVALQDLASPVAAFVRERCAVGPYEVAVKAAFEDWREWAEVTGNRVGSTQTFARDLRAVVPGLRLTRSRDGDMRERRYQGIRLAGLVDGPSRQPADHRGPDPIGHHDGGGPRWSAARSSLVATALPALADEIEVHVGQVPDGRTQT